MNITLTSRILQWELFRKPNRIQVLLVLLAKAKADGEVETNREYIGSLTGLSPITIDAAIQEFQNNGILLIERTGRMRLCRTPDGIELPKSRTVQKRTVAERSSVDSTPRSPVPVRFRPPTLTEVTERVREKGYHFDPETFLSFYESKGWMVGKNKMKNWRAACVTFEKRVSQNDKRSNYQQQRDESRRLFAEANLLGGAHEVEVNASAEAVILLPHL